MRVTNTAAKLQWGEIKQQGRIHDNPTLQKQSHLLISMGGEKDRWTREYRAHCWSFISHLFPCCTKEEKKKQAKANKKKI